jgi:capsular exopolysaccharide synthesis family protein
MSPDKPFRKLLITSSTPEEGKTMLACSTAISMAQAGPRVLLVDCDLRRPRLHQIFGRDNREGFTTAILDPDSIERLDLSTDLPRLDVLTSGPVPPNPAELLHSDRFRVLLRRLESRYDRIIFDSPPVVPVTDAAVLSRLVDGTVLVVRAFKTRKDLALRAVRTLQDVSANVVGAVLNSVNLGRPEYSGAYAQYPYPSRKDEDREKQGT